MTIRPSAIAASIAAISFLSACIGPSVSSGVGVNPTQPGATPSQASEAQKPILGIVSKTECYTGPGTNYDPLGVLAAGNHFRVAGLSDEVTSTGGQMSWYKINPTAIVDPDPPIKPVNELSPQPDPPGSVRCWVPDGAVELSGDLSGLPVIKMPLVETLGSAQCLDAPAEGSDVARSLDGGMFFPIIAAGEGLAWFEIDPTAIADPDPPPKAAVYKLVPRLEASASERCWLSAASVDLSGDVSQVPAIPIPTGLSSAQDVSLEIYRGPLQVDARCSAVFEERPAVHIIRTPRTLDAPTVSVDGEPSGLCYGTYTPPGAMECLMPMSVVAGSTVTVRTCFPGDVCSEWPRVVPTCPEPSITEVVPVCSTHFDHHTAVQIHAAPASFDELHVYMGTAPTGLCHTPAAGVWECLPLLGEVGSRVVVSTWLPDEGSQYWPVTIPDCSGEPPITYTITSTCFRSPAIYQAAIITYEGSDSPLGIARADGTELICSGSTGRYACHNIPGEPGEEVTITFCTRAGECFSGPVTVSDCSAAATTSTPWEIVATGCHDTERIYFILQTSLAWLIPGADFAYTANDGVTSYSCEVSPTMPGRLYCSGTRPGGPGQLRVTIMHSLFSLASNSFVNWPTMVRRIGSCAPPTRLPAAVDACAAWSGNPNLCIGHGCKYDNGICHSPP